MLVLCVLASACCFGAMAAGSCASTPPEIQAPPPSQQTAAAPVRNHRLTLVEKEYTMADIKSLDLSGIVVETLAEHVSITRGGDTLKFSYYTGNETEYTLKREPDGGGTRWNFCLIRTNPIGEKEPERTISITVPNALNLKAISAVTTSGNIRFENCTTSMFMTAETQSGNVVIEGGAAKGSLQVKTGSGNALISGTVLQEQACHTFFETESGSIVFQPKDAVQNYHFIIDTDAAARVAMNGREYAGGDYEINGGAPQMVYFDSASGSLLAQDFSRGTLQPDFLKTQAGSGRLKYRLHQRMAATQR